MKRREQPEEPGTVPPLELRRYDPADWPNPECHPECAFWAAVEAWDEEHPFDPDDGRPLKLIENAPDGPWHPERI